MARHLPSILLSAALALFTLQGVASKTFEQEVAEAKVALSRLSDYSLILKYPTYIDKVVAKLKRKQGTLLAPTNGAIRAAFWHMGRFVGKMDQTLNIHMLRGIYRLGNLKAAGANYPSTTIGGAKLMKTSGANQLPLRLKPPSYRYTAAITKRIYVGNFVALYGIDAVLAPP